MHKNIKLQNIVNMLKKYIYLLHNNNNAVSSNKSKNQKYIIVIMKANADKKALAFFLCLKQ